MLATIGADVLVPHGQESVGSVSSHGHTRVTLGLFPDRKSAAAAHDRAALCLGGLTARCLTQDVPLDISVASGDLETVLCGLRNCGVPGVEARGSEATIALGQFAAGIAGRCGLGMIEDGMSMSAGIHRRGSTILAEADTETQEGGNAAVAACGPDALLVQPKLP